MRRMLFGLASGLLTFASSAWAEGPIVRWDRIEGVLTPSGSPIEIGDQDNKIQSHAAMWSVGKGRAMVNLETGFVSFQLEGLAYANTITSSAIGALPENSPVKGTVVCNAGRSSPWPIEFADTADFVLESGTGSFTGFVAIPPMCLQNPYGIAFLVRRTADRPQCPDCFVAYGAGRTMQ